MKRSLVSLVLGASLIFTMVGCSSATNKASEEVTQLKEERDETAFELNYLQIILNTNKDTEVVLGEMGDIFDKAKMHPELFKNADWKYDLKSSFKELRQNYEQLKSIPNKDIPKKYKASHDNMVLGYEHFLESEKKIMEGVDTLNPDKLYEGIEFMKKGSSKVSQSIYEMAE